jgi:hypothetical protein
MTQMSNIETVKGDENQHLFLKPFVYIWSSCCIYFLITLIDPANRKKSFFESVVPGTIPVCGIKNLSFIPIQKIYS